MATETSYSSDDKIFHIVVDGTFTLKEMKDCILSVKNNQELYQFRKMIVDFTTADIKVSMADVYFMPRFFREIEFNRHTVYTAFICNNINYKIISFMETVYANNGIQSRTFFKKKDCLIWLRAVRA